MTTPSSTGPEARQAAESQDHVEYPFGYGKGRMPFFMKVVWVAFLAFATWYIVSFLLEAAGTELAVK